MAPKWNRYLLPIEDVAVPDFGMNFRILFVASRKYDTMN